MVDANEFFGEAILTTCHRALREDAALNLLMPASMHKLRQLADKATTSPTLRSSSQQAKIQAAAIWEPRKHTRQMLKHKTYTHVITVPSTDRIHEWQLKNTGSCTKLRNSSPKLSTPEENSCILTLRVHDRQMLAAGESAARSI